MIMVVFSSISSIPYLSNHARTAAGAVITSDANGVDRARGHQCCRYGKTDNGVVTVTTL